MARFKYNVINKKGKQEEWTGVFDDIELAKKWFKQNALFHQLRGHELVLVKTKRQEICTPIIKPI